MRSDDGEKVSFTYVNDEDGEPALTIVEAVGWVTGVDGRDLDPLHDVLDTETLEGLFKRDGGTFYRDASRSTADDCELSFRYMGCEVTVTADHIYVEPSGSVND